MQSIFNNTNFNTKVSYSEFWKSISYIIENLNYFFDQYKLNKNNLSEVNFSNKIENYNKFLDENYDNLIFYQINFDSLLNENKFVFKECFNSKCELKSKDSKFLTNLILGRNIDRKKNILFTNKNLKLPELKEKSFVYNNNKINFIYSRNLEVNLDKEKQLINIYKNHEKDFILFYDSNFENLTVNFHVKEKNILEKTNIDRANEFNLTGCINFYKVEFNNVKMNINDANCEDALNILNSKGTISELNINNSYADGFDADFSDLTILNLNIKNAFNDCADFSLGKYYIKNADLNFCGDKGISIGENSYMEIENLKSYYSNIALASKDSSKTKIISGEIENVKYCLSAYKKKQEFNGSLIQIKNLNCKNYFKKFDIDEYSKLNTETENL